MVKSTLPSLAAMLTCVSSLCSVRAESGQLGLVAVVAAWQSELSPPGQLGIVAAVAVWLLEFESAAIMPDMFTQSDKPSTADLGLSGLEVFEIGQPASKV